MSIKYKIPYDTGYCLIGEPLIKQLDNAMRLGISKEELWLTISYAYETAVRFYQEYLEQVEAGH